MWAEIKRDEKLQMIWCDFKLLAEESFHQRNVLYHQFFSGSSPVRDLSVTIINSTTFDVSFVSPSAPNGIIDHYEIDVSNVLDMPSNFTVIVDNSNATDHFVATTTGLCE